MRTKSFASAKKTAFCFIVSVASSASAGTKVSTDQKKIWLPGASGTGPYDVVSAWVPAFTSLYPEADLTLSSVGTGAAQTALWGEIDCKGRPVSAICNNPERGVYETVWGIGDAPLKDDVYGDHPLLELQQFPACAGAVAVVYSKEISSANSEEGLKLTMEVLGGIFNTSIAYWDDSRIQVFNPQIKLPHIQISKVVRVDSSGQSSIFTDALDYNNPEWPDEAVGKMPKWPLGEMLHPSEVLGSQSCLMGQDATTRTQSYGTIGKNDLSLGMLRIPYSIGYMETGTIDTFGDFLKQAQIGAVHAQKDDISFYEANEETLKATMSGLAEELNPDTLGLNLARAVTPPGGYPISGYAYWYLPKSAEAFTDCYMAWLVCKFVEWSYVDPLAAELALARGWVVPPENVVNATLARLNDVKCLNIEQDPPVVISALSYVPPPYRPAKEILDTLLLGTVIGAGGLILLLLLFWLNDRKRRNGDHVWKIAGKEIIFGQPPEIIGRGKFGEVLLAQYRGTTVAVKRIVPPKQLCSGNSKDESAMTTLSSGNNMESRSNGKSSRLCRNSGSLQGIGSASGKASGSLERMGRLFLGSNGSRQRRKDFVKEMRCLSKLRHPCITTIMGAVMEKELMLVMEYMEHGGLHDILHNNTMLMEADMVLHILRDVAQGVRFLHATTPTIVHGDLKSPNILVDSKFRAKVSDFGLSFKGATGTGTVSVVWLVVENI